MKTLVFRFSFEKDIKKNNMTVYDLILLLRTRTDKTLNIIPLRASDYSGRIEGLKISGEDSSVHKIISKLKNILRDKKIKYTREELKKHNPSSESEVFQESRKYLKYKNKFSKPKSLAERHLKSGIAFYNLGLNKEAFSQLHRAVSLDINLAQAHFYLGLVYEQIEQYTKSILAYQRAIKLEPENGINLFFLGNAYHQIGLYEKAVQSYKKAIVLDPGNSLIYNNLGWIFYQRGEFEKGIRAFEQALSIDPGAPFPHTGLGCIYQDMGYLDEAIDELEQAIEVFPEYTAAHLKLGWVWFERRFYDKAIIEFSYVSAKSADTQHLSSAHLGLAKSYLIKGDWSQSKTEFSKVVKLDSKNAFAYFKLGQVCVKLKSYKEAVKNFQKAGKLNLQFRTQTHKGLAMAFFGLKKYQQAIKECKGILKAEHNDPEMYELLGSIYAKMQRSHQAINYWNKAIMSNPNSPRCYFNLARVCEEKDKTESVGYYKKAIKVNENFVKAYVNLGRLYLEQDKTKEALIVFEQALNKDFKGDFLPYTHFYLGLIYQKEEKLKLAIKEFTNSLKLNKEKTGIYSEVYYRVGKCYFDLGSKSKAKLNWQKYLKLSPQGQFSLEINKLLDKSRA